MNLIGYQVSDGTWYKIYERYGIDERGYYIERVYIEC